MVRSQASKDFALPHAVLATSGSRGQSSLSQHCPCLYVCAHPHARPAALSLSLCPCQASSTIPVPVFVPMPGQQHRPCRHPWWPHLDLLVAGREATLLEERRVLPAPLQQPCHHLVVLLPAQLQLLQGRGTCVGLGVMLQRVAAAVVTPNTPTHVGLDTILHLGHARHGVVQRGHVGDDGLLVRLRHIHICGEGGGQVGDTVVGREGALQRDPPSSPSGSSSRVTPRSRSATVKAWSRFSRLLWRYTRLMSISIGLWVEGQWVCGNPKTLRKVGSPPLSWGCQGYLLCLYSCPATPHPTPHTKGTHGKRDPPPARTGTGGAGDTHSPQWEPWHSQSPQVL